MRKTPDADRSTGTRVAPESTTPPRLALLTLRRICAPGSRSEVEGDLHEAFGVWVAARGRRLARLRYWREVALLAFWRLLGSWRRFQDRRKEGPVQAQRHLRDPISPPTTSPEPARPDPARGSRGPGDAGGDWTTQLLQDARFGFRKLTRSPASTGIAILLLAIAVGGNVMVYTVVERVFMEPPPLIQAPEELVGLDWAMTRSFGAEFGYYDYEFYRDHGEAFADVLAYGGFPGSRGRRTDDGGGEVVVGRGETVEQAGAWVVSGNYFRVLGVPMGRGTGFSPEVQEGAELHAEVVLSHAYWARALGSDPSVLDRPLFINGVPFRIAGVTPREFRGLNPAEPLPDLFIPILSAEAISLGYRDQLRRFQADGSPSASRFLRLVARLEPGIDVVTAQAEAGVLQRRWEAEFSSWAETVYGEPYQLRIRADFSMAPFESRLLRRQLYFLWFFAGAVFLIGCINLAILLLASASGREREMGIRGSLGAGQNRLLGQLVTESLILSLLGGLAGVGLAYLTGGAMGAAVSANLDTSFRPDGSVVLFALFLSTGAAILFGTAPAWTLSRIDVAVLLQRPGQGRTRALFRGGLVVTQTALSALLLIACGLLGRSVQGLQRIDLGFDPDRRLVMSVQLENNGYTEDQGQTFVLSTLDRLRQVPGVRWATTCNRLPFLGSNTWTFTAPGTDFAQEGLRTTFNLAGPDYFQAMGIPIVAGRAFTRDDISGTPVVAVVNENFANRVWPGESPLGKALDFAGENATVVGVAATAVYHSVTESPRTHAYLSSLQWYQGRQNFVVATEALINTMVPPVEQAMREIAPNLAISPMSLQDLVDDQSSSYRIWTALVGVFAGVALFLALVGLYGVQSYLVARRTREIGVRMAMGAEARSVLGGVLRSGLAMGGVGVLVGIAAALGLTRLMRGFLVGVAPNDPLVFMVVPALLLVVCGMASLVPALRASRVDPAEALSVD
jgi:predicted permease